MKLWIILLIILVVIIAAFVALYIWGNKMQKKSEAQRTQMMEMAQTTSMLVIDKKRMKISEANLPKMVMEQTPKRFRNSKLPIVKAKIGPQIMSLICDETIFDQVPVKTEVKAQISGIYIVGIKNIRNVAPQPEIKKKKSFRARLIEKQRKLQAQVNAEKEANQKQNKKSKKK